MSTIPASTVVNVLPGVLAAGGSSLDLNGLMLTNSTRIPVGTVQEFGTAAAVSDYFGATSAEASFAAVYFAGFDDSSVKPGALLGTQYNVAPVAAFLRGADLAASTSLAQLTAFSGTLSVTIDGVLKTASVNLSGATSFTNAAEIIGAALAIDGVNQATVTGSIAGTTFTAASGLTGTIAPGQVLVGSGITATTYIVAQLTGTPGGLGTYQVSISQTAGSTSVSLEQPGVEFDSVSGAFIIHSGTTGASSTITYGSGALATSLMLTQALGAAISQGAVGQVPAAFMDTIATNVRNWATFFLTFNPDNSGNDIRLAFAQWAAGQSSRYVAVLADSDAAPAASSSAASSLGARVRDNDYGSVSVNWQPSETYIAAFIAGAAASINFDELNGRITFNGRSQSGLTPGVTSETVQTNLLANGYNFYGAFGTANDEFVWYADGKVSGSFTWLDSLVNSIWLTNAFQLALMTLLQNTRSIPYNSVGKAIIEQSLQDTIQQGLAFGAYRTGVSLSGTQKAYVNGAAGNLDVASTLTIQGWYLFVGDATPTTRQQRGSPPCTFFYMDGEAVQKINLQSIVLL